jgi:hypothetical protein
LLLLFEKPLAGLPHLDRLFGLGLHQVFPSFFGSDEFDDQEARKHGQQDAGYQLDDEGVDVGTQVLEVLALVVADEDGGVGGVGRGARQHLSGFGDRHRLLHNLERHLQGDADQRAQEERACEGDLSSYVAAQFVIVLGVLDGDVLPDGQQHRQDARDEVESLGEESVEDDEDGQVVGVVPGELAAVVEQEHERDVLQHHQEVGEGERRQDHVGGTSHLLRRQHTNVQHVGHRAEDAYYQTEVSVIRGESVPDVFQITISHVGAGGVHCSAFGNVMAERRHSTLPLLERLPGHRNTRLTRLTLPVSTCNLTRSFSNGEKLEVIAGGGSAQALTFSQKFHPEKMRRENAPVEAVPTLLRLNKKLLDEINLHVGARLPDCYYEYLKMN